METESVAGLKTFLSTSKISRLGMVAVGVAVMVGVPVSVEVGVNVGERVGV